MFAWSGDSHDLELPWKPGLETRQEKDKNKLTSISLTAILPASDPVAFCCSTFWYACSKATQRRLLSGFHLLRLFSSHKTSLLKEFEWDRFWSEPKSIKSIHYEENNVSRQAANCPIVKYRVITFLLEESPAFKFETVLPQNSHG